jgi:hypothetical protein
MDQAAFEADVREQLAKELQLGRINEEIRRAHEEIARCPLTGVRTELMLAKTNLAHWQAKKLILERGLAL